ncbi:MAG: metal ABC transporter permease [Rickettsiales bacterium]
MIDPFIIKALIAGAGVALMCGPLGCFIAWQRLAFFGHAIAHAALLGIVLSLLVGTNFDFGIMIVAIAIAIMVFQLEKGRKLASDTLLGVFSHGALALGLVILALSPSVTLDINGLLFGDILAVSNDDITTIFLIAAIVDITLLLNWRNLMRLTIHPDIAQVEGVPVARLRLLLMIGIALTVAVSIKIVGLLLITSMLIIPAASMRYFSGTPTAMALLAIVAGVVSVCGGLYASLLYDTPSGPSIIIAALAIFIAAYLVDKFKSIMTGT